MKCNMGSLDRIIRGLIGIGVVIAGFYYQSWWGILGVFPLLIALLGWCPAYAPFGISSCKTDEHA